MFKQMRYVDWETNRKVINTRGGQYVGNAASEEIAKIMVVNSKLAKLLLELHQDDPAIQSRIKDIIEAVNNQG